MSDVLCGYNLIRLGVRSSEIQFGKFISGNRYRILNFKHRNGKSLPGVRHFRESHKYGLFTLDFLSSHPLDVSFIPFTKLHTLPRLSIQL